jgi:hypothetical protein
VHLEHVRSHLAVDHSFKGVPKEEELKKFLLELGAFPRARITFPKDPISPIVGLDIIEGFECLEGGCHYISTSSRSRYDHFRTKHVQQHSGGVGISTRSIQVQLLYGFKGDRVVLKVLPNHSQQSATLGGYEKYLAQVASRKQLDPSTYQLQADVRLQSHFLSLTKWGSVVEGANVEAIRGLVARPLEHDRFYPILAGCRSYYEHIASRLPGVSELFLRWVNTFKS